VSDAIDPAPTWTGSVSSGSVLPVGEHSVRVTARDAAGNTAVCAFSITVQAVGGGTPDGGGDADGGSGVDGGTPGGGGPDGGAPDGGTGGVDGGNPGTEEPPSGGGCGCQGGGSAPGAFLGLAWLLALARRRGGSALLARGLRAALPVLLCAPLFLPACEPAEFPADPEFSTHVSALELPVVSAESALAPPQRMPKDGMHTGPQVAYHPTANVFLSVWVVEKYGAYDVLASRIAPDGTPLDAGGILLSTQSGTDLLPRVVFDGEHFLVVWRNYYSTTRLLGVRVTAEGRVVGPSGFVIASGSTAEYLSLASDGDVTLVVWGNTGTLHGARVRRDGTVVDAAPLVLAPRDGVSKWAPSVAFGGGVFLVAWEEYSSTTSTDIFCKTVTPEGVISETSTPLAVEPNGQNRPSVAFDGTSFLVAWEDRRADVSNGDIYARRVRPDGTAIDASAFAVSTATGSQEAPSTAFDGTRFWVVWSDKRGGSKFDLYGARVDPDGTVVDAAGRAISTATEEQRLPSLASTGGGVLAVWEDWRRKSYYTDARDIYATPLAADGTVGRPSGALVNFEVEPQRDAVVAFDGTRYLVVWSDPEDYRLLALRLGLDGKPLGAAVSLKESITGAQGSPEVAFNGTDFVVVWAGSNSSVSGILATRVSPEGVVRDANGLAVSTTVSGWLKNPAIACNDAGSCLIAWADQRSGQEFDIYGTFLGPYGSVSPSKGFLISGANWDQDLPAVASDGKDFFVTWEDRRGAVPQVAGTRGKADGAVLSPEGLRLRVSSRAQYEPRVASDSASYLVAFHERGATPEESDVLGVRVGLDGALLDAAALPVGAASLRQKGADVAFDGLQYLVTWTDERNGNEDLFAARVRSDGTLLDASPSQLVLAAGASSEAKSRVAAGKGQAMVGYTLFDETSSVRAEQVRVRTVTGLGSGGALGEACSEGAQCASGYCVDGVCCNSACGGSNATDCQACSRAAGAQVDGRCSPEADYTSCDDADRCSSYSYCRAGVCQSSGSRTCPAPDACHEPGACNASTGDCDPGLPRPEGSYCPGGTCRAGVCTPYSSGTDGGVDGGVDGGLDGGVDGGDGGVTPLPTDGGVQLPETDGGVDGGVTPPRDAGTGDGGVSSAPPPEEPAPSSGCGCQSGAEPAFLLGLLALVGVRSRRSRGAHPGR